MSRRRGDGDLSVLQKLLKALSCGLYRPDGSAKKGELKNTHVQILVVGDKGVGKSTLINNYVNDSGSTEVEFSKASELIRIVNANNVIQNPQNADEHTNIHVTLVDVEGAVNNVNKQIRDGYYTTSQIIIILYNVGENLSLYHSQSQWHKEIQEATQRMNRDDSDKVQLYLLGVNPEARDQLQVLDEEQFLTDPNADDYRVDVFRRSSQRTSVKKSTAAQLSRKLSVGKSRKSAKHVEVKTTRADIKKFFGQVISDYVYPQDAE